jgi:probable phosphoglycerate mutase
METDLVLVRHGEAHCNLLGVAGGDRGCTGLTGRGREQAHRLGGRLAQLHARRPFDVVFVAPRRRVRETADLATAGLGVPAVVEPRLSGPAHGEADGLPWTRIWAEFGGSPADRPDQPFAPGAESWNQFVDRATSCLTEILVGHAGHRVLVVGHAETVEAAHTLLMGLPPGRAAFVVAHASLTWWSHRQPQVGAARWHLISHNATCHLDGPAPFGKEGAAEGVLRS